MLIYVASKYRGPTSWDVERNIMNARILGAEVAKLGAMPVVPHAATAHYDGLQDDEWWLENTKDLMRRCDGVIFAHDWRESEGSIGEFEEAARIGLPCFFSLRELNEWLESRAAAE